MEEIQEYVKSAEKYLKGGHYDSVIKTVEDAFRVLNPKIIPKILESHKMPEEDIIIIHYTSIGALVSMLNHAKNENPASFRLYDTIHCNDPDEGKYIYRKLEHFYRKKEANHPWFATNEEVANHAYITSFVFSDAGQGMEDDLVFWRAYGKEGEGCSLSIPLKKDNKLHSNLMSNLRKVLYGEKAEERAFDKLRPVLQFIPVIENLPNALSRNNLKDAFLPFLDPIRYLYKSEAYEHEHECRYVYTNPNNGEKPVFEYQEQNRSPLRIRHYHELTKPSIKDLLKVSGSRITLGPCVPYRENVRKCIEKLLKEAELEGPNVIESKISYRKS